MAFVSGLAVKGFRLLPSNRHLDKMDVGTRAKWEISDKMVTGSNYRVVERPPRLFRLAKFMIRSNVRGGYRLLDVAHKLGLLNCIVRYRLTNAVTIDVPIFIDQWSEADIWDYERPLVDMFVALASDLEGPIELVDCGAEIGLISVLLAARCPGLVRIRAFEPNERVFPFLASNLHRLPVEAEAHRAGLGDFDGMGFLRRPEHDRSDHARFVERKSEGDFPVLKVDDVGVGSDCNLILKIDVEGGELAVLKGAPSTLARVRDFIISVEAHPLQVKRTGIDPMECFRFVQSLRPCSAVMYQILCR